jgi:type IV secretory pathway VirB10-like protein
MDVQHRSSTLKQKISKVFKRFKRLCIGKIASFAGKLATVFYFCRAHYYLTREIAELFRGMFKLQMHTLYDQLSARIKRITPSALNKAEENKSPNPQKEESPAMKRLREELATYRAKQQQNQQNHDSNHINPPQNGEASRGKIKNLKRRDYIKPKLMQTIEQNMANSSRVDNIAMSQESHVNAYAIFLTKTRNPIDTTSNNESFNDLHNQDINSKKSDLNIQSKIIKTLH